MYDGIMFLGRPFEGDSDNGNRKYQFCLLAGSLIADPKIEMFNSKKTSFTVKWHSKSYCNVEIWGDSDVAAIAATLEKGDMVFVAGTYVTQKYTVRKGEHKGEEREWTSVNTQVLIPMPYLVQLMKMCGSKNLNKMLEEEEESMGADIMESANDFVPQGNPDDDFMQLGEDDISVDDLFK